MSIKILIDTNIIDKDKISQLNGDKLNQLLKKRSLIVYGNPTLLQETFDLWLEGDKKKANDYLEYIISISNGRWFRSLDEITKLELEGHSMGRHYYFMTEKETNNIKERIKDLILVGNILKEDEEWLRSEHIKSSDRKEKLKSSCVGMRNNISKIIKEKRLKYPGAEKINEMFTPFCNSHIDSFAENEIMEKMETAYKRQTLFDKWKANKSSYPFFTLWVKAALYIAYHALMKPNASIDPNASEDITHLTFMNTLDVFVSDDTKFQKDGFHQLYGDSKAFWTFEDLKACISNG